MPFHYFGPDDLFSNRVKAYPQYNFFIYNKNIFINNSVNIPDGASGSDASSYPYENPWNTRSSLPSGEVTGSTTIEGVPSGSISLYEYNINRRADINCWPVVCGPKKPVQLSLITPFIEYRGNQETFKKFLKNSVLESYQHATDGNVIKQGNYQFPAPGTIIAGSYPMSASLTRKLTGVTEINWQANAVAAGGTSNRLQTTFVNVTASALANVARNYTSLSKHYIFTPTGSYPYTAQWQTAAGVTPMYPEKSNAGVFGSNSKFLTRDLLQQDINMIFVPQIFFGSRIKKGSVNLRFNITGSLLRRCSDFRENGELVDFYHVDDGVTQGWQTGSVVGLVMYNEGIIMLTSSAPIETGPALGIKYLGASNNAALSSWMYFGAGLNDGITYDNTLTGSSFDIEFKGTNYVNTMTMFCHAKRGDLNYSNNPTYRKFSEVNALNDVTSSHFTFAEKQYGIKNIVSSSYVGVEDKFEKTTYISKIALYDDAGNMIGVSSLSKPVKKTEDLEYTFKLKLDI